MTANLSESIDPGEAVKPVIENEVPYREEVATARFSFELNNVGDEFFTFPHKLQGFSWIRGLLLDGNLEFFRVTPATAEPTITQVLSVLNPEAATAALVFLRDSPTRKCNVVFSKPDLRYPQEFYSNLQLLRGRLWAKGFDVVDLINCDLDKVAPFLPAYRLTADRKYFLLEDAIRLFDLSFSDRSLDIEVKRVAIGL